MKVRHLATKAAGSTRISFEHAKIPAGVEVDVKGVVYEGHDELVYVLAGKAELGFDGQTRTVGPGSFFLVPDSVPYDFKVIEGPFEALGAFSPPRE